MLEEYIVSLMIRSPNIDGLELNGIKDTQGLATSIGDTYLVITSNVISNISGTLLRRYQIAMHNTLQGL